jgi:DNA ligase-1
VSTVTTTPIYKRDSAGNLREWRQEIEGSRYRTIAGLSGGNQAVSEWTQATPKNVGRANETTAEQQACAEVAANYEAKLKREYFLTIEETDAPRFFKPMLAHAFDPAAAVYPVWSQPKLDGIRALASAKGLATREGQPIVSCPHITDALAPFFEVNPDAILDGEIYNHDLADDFNAIVSTVKRTHCSADQLAASAEIAEFHVYDFPSFGHLGFSARAKAVAFALVEAPPCIRIVPTHRVDAPEHLDALYGEYLAASYEGQMVRTDTPYEQKRSKSLLKRKQFEDAEFRIVAIEEGTGNWAGVAKRVTLHLGEGRTFGAGIRGTRERARALLTETWEKATVRYFALTPDGVPRFPVVTKFHNGRRM